MLRLRPFLLGLVCGAALLWLGLAITGGATTTTVLASGQCQTLRERGLYLPPGTEILPVDPHPCVWRVSRIHLP